MRGQLGRQVVPVDLHVDEVHGQRELVLVQEPVLVDVRQFPDLAEHRVRQLRLHHLRLGGCRQTSPGQLSRLATDTRARESNKTRASDKSLHSLPSNIDRTTIELKIYNVSSFIR